MDGPADIARQGVGRPRVTWAPACELVKETWFNGNRRASEKEAAGFSPMRHPPPLHRPAA
jgi:hypothetical protein